MVGQYKRRLSTAGVQMYVYKFTSILGSFDLDPHSIKRNVRLIKSDVMIRLSTR